MGQTIFEKEDTVNFVGGITTKTGDDNAGGGCSLADWNDAGSLNKQLSDVMEDDGTPKSDDGAWNGAHSGCTVRGGGGGGDVRLTREGAFVNVKVGLIANVEFLNPVDWVNGRYKVKARTDDMITLDYPDAGSADSADVKVGGAFAKFQTAWANTPCCDNKNPTIYSNKNQSFGAGDFTATWHPGGGGFLTNETFKRFCGFETQPEDGGQITFDGGGDAAFSPDGGINLSSALDINEIFENIIVKNAYVNWKTSNVGVNSIRFINCQGNDATIGWWLNYGRGFVLIDCRGNDNSQYGFWLGYASGAPNHLLIKCIAHGNTREGFKGVGALGGGQLIGCLAYDNGNGGTKYSGFTTSSTYGCGAKMNCVAYNNGKHGFEFARANPIAINCIAKDNGQWGFYADMAVNDIMAPHVTHCCAHGNGSGQFSLFAALPEKNCTEEDPLFKDAANADFRLKNKLMGHDVDSPCLNIGKETLGKS